MWSTSAGGCARTAAGSGATWSSPPCSTRTASHVGYTKVTRDLTEQHELEARLRGSEERLRLLVGQVQDYAIIALDPQGAIETWNLGAERVKGYTAEEAIGRSFAMFYTEEDRRSGLPLRLLTEARVERPGRAHRLAGAQGRHPLLG